MRYPPPPDPQLAMPPNGYRNLRTFVKWVCPRCQRVMPLPELFTHLEESHGIVRHGDHGWRKTVQRIEAANGDR